MTKFFAEPITCSTKDALWSMPLPPLLNDYGYDVKVKMETDSRIFDFDTENSIVFLSSENRNRLFNGELCPE